MSIEFLGIALFAISFVTGLTVEGIKKLLEGTNRSVSSNLLAAIVSVIISIVASVAYAVITHIAFSAVLVLEIIELAFLSFLVSTIGYDKVMQMLRQFALKKDSSDTANDNEDNEDNEDAESK